MARIRTIKPEFFDDEEVAAMSFPARLGYIGLWQQADREGRLRDRPVRLKARIFPFDDVDMVALLNEMERHKFIRRYSVGGEPYIYVRTLAKHQQIHPKEAPSALPPPPDGEPGNFTAQPNLSTQEGKGREGNGKGRSDSAEPPSDSPPAVLVFPVVGPQGPTWNLTRSHVEDLSRDYPATDVVSECRKASAWVKANPGRRKTARGMPAFLVNWLNRTVDRGGSQSPTPRSTAAASNEPYWLKACPHTPKCRGGQQCYAKLGERKST